MIFPEHFILDLWPGSDYAYFSLQFANFEPISCQTVKDTSAKFGIPNSPQSPDIGQNSEQ